MSNLTSTVPGAFNALYGLIATAAAAQAPPIDSFHTEITQQYEPASYVLLATVENYVIEPAAVGSYAFYEEYDLCGQVSVLQGDTDAQTVLVAAWALYQSLVVTPVVQNRGQGTPVLGSSAPAGLVDVIPVSAGYAGEPGQLAGGIGGFAGTVSFGVRVRARLTVP